MNLLYRVQKNRGFSLIQILIAILISGFVLAGAIMMGFKFLSKTANTSARANLLNKSKQGLLILEQDFNQAIRITGLTSEIRPGIAPFDTLSNQVAAPRSDSDEFEHITLYVHNVPSFGLRLDQGFNYDASTQTLSFNVDADFEPIENTDVDPNNDIPQSQLQIREFFSGAHGSHSLYSIRGLEDTDVLDKVASVYDTSTREISFSFSNRVRSQQVINSTGSLGDGPFSLRTVERIDYFIPTNGPDANKLIREVRRVDDFTVSPRLRTVIATNAHGLKLDYIFGPNDGSQSHEDLSEIVGIYFRHKDNANDYVVTSDPVSWKNIIRVKASLSVSSDQEIDGSTSDSSVYASIQLNGKSYWLIEDDLEATPIDYNLDKGQQLAFEQGTECHPDNPMSRCNPECEDEEIFTSPDVNAKDWEGYARHRATDNPLGPSNYCLCGQDPGSMEFAPPDYAANRDAIPNYQFGNTDVNLRLAQCVGHFGWNTPWRHKDPRAWLINDGLNQASDFYTSNTPGYYAYDDSAFDSLVGDMNAYMGSADKPQYAADYHRVRCRWQSTLDARLRTLTGIDSLDIGRTRCGCLIRDLDINGDVTTTTINQRRYDLMCDPVACPNNVQDNGGTFEYAVHSDPSEQLLSEGIAGICECARTHAPAQHSGPSSQWRQIDFRADVPTGSPYHDANNIGAQHLPAGYTLPPTEAKFLSTTSLEVTVNKIGGGSFTAICAEVQCGTHEMRPSVGCCTHNPNYGENASLQGVYTDHDDYCSGQCGWLPETENSRHVITQTLWGEDLPVSCGGPSGDDNFNDGVVDGSGN